MEITVENKSISGFDVRIGFDAGQILASYYTKVMTHVVNRMDNYYDANGLVDIDWKFAEDDEEAIETIIEVFWNDEEKLPAETEIVDNVKRWLEEVID